eukprot:1245951-Rhodomonas_salina.1
MVLLWKVVFWYHGDTTMVPCWYHWVQMLESGTTGYKYWYVTVVPRGVNTGIRYHGVEIFMIWYHGMENGILVPRGGVSLCPYAANSI